MVTQMEQQVFKSPIEQANSLKRLNKKDLTALVRTPGKFNSIDEVLGWIDSLKPEDLDFEMNENHKADIADDWQIWIDHPDWNWQYGTTLI